jgi:3-hydroxyisobutyrate dehydrogenase/2-hydroxy-3-oxopropionate reductase
MNDSPDNIVGSVGIIGLGSMGKAMATCLAAHGYLGSVYNRTIDTARSHGAALGVTICDSPADLAAQSRFVLTTVSDDDALLDVYEGDEGVTEGIRPDTLCLEMSTVSPGTVARLQLKLAELGSGIVDAPVSGSVDLARHGDLTILVGSTEEQFERARPLLQALGKRIFHLGPLGCGAIMKLVVNNVVYGLNQSVAESLVLAERSGVPRSRAYEVLANSAVTAPFVEYRRELFERPDDMPAQMYLELAKKDLDLIGDLGDTVGAYLPQRDINAAVLQAAIDEGMGLDDVTGVAQHLRTRAEAGEA